MIEPFIIDVHTHLGFTRGFRAPLGSTDDFISLMDDTATEISVVIPMALLDAQFELGYRQTLKDLEKYPHRLKAYTVFDPNWPDVSLRWIEKHIDHPGFVGIKIHPAVHAVAPQDSRYGDLWCFAEERRCVVISHSWSPDPAKPTQDLSTPDRFGPIIEAHPNVRLILGHTGGREVGHRMAMEIVKRHPNCWVDISGDSYPLGQLEWFVEEMGADRILFGTDSNWIEPRYHVGRVLKASLSEEDRLKIFRLNAIDIFRGALHKC